MSNINMAELTTETLQSYIQTDRKTLLEKITKDMASVSQKDSAEYLSKFNQRVPTYMELAMPEVSTKKRKVKVERFRKTSPYFAYCTNFRNSKRNKEGKLTENVLDITKEAGSNWRAMSEKDRKPWIEAANKLTAQAKVAWDAKHSAPSPSPTPEIIREMKKNELMEIAEKESISLPKKLSLKDLRELVVAHFTPVVADTSPAPVQVSGPTPDQITKMKKSELLALVEKAGITSKKDTKAMQQALISHYSA